MEKELIQPELLPTNPSRPSDRRVAFRTVLMASVFGALGVLLGAWGAHGLENYLVSAFGGDAAWLAKRLAQFDTGVRYQLVHAVALLALTGSPPVQPRVIGLITMAWSVGTVFFSGTLYLLVLTNTPWFGAITPIGGVILIGGWVGLLFVSRSR
jgi:uncharacterized membrane protein YgdD (TMEM256/DUF423 family)